MRKQILERRERRLRRLLRLAPLELGQAPRGERGAVATVDRIGGGRLPGLPRGGQVALESQPVALLEPQLAQLETVPGPPGEAARILVVARRGVELPAAKREAAPVMESHEQPHVVMLLPGQ